MVVDNTAGSTYLVELHSGQYSGNYQTLLEECKGGHLGKTTKRIYEFGTFRLDTEERLLLNNGETVPLTPKVFDTLVVLVQKAGHVVGKEELMNEVWADSFVEESNLTQNISVLRKVLGEDRGRSYIETLSKRGYRFVAGVREVSSDSDSVATEMLKGPRIIFGEGAQDDVLNSIAVLPLINGSANPDAEYLSDGITESIINSLSQLPQLRVMARSTVFRYKGKDVEPRDVGQTLGVRAVMVGRVLQISDSLIVRTELVDVAKGWQLWGEQYNRKLIDILTLQEEIAQDISEKLKIRLTGKQKERLTKRYTDDSEAYRLYLKGRYYWNKYTKEGLAKAIDYFNQSIGLDPGYSLAYTGLADSYYRLSTAYLPPKEALTKARTAAMKALEIDDTLAEAHASLGLIKMYHDWDWSGAEREYKRAIELDPRTGQGYLRYGTYFQLLGRFDEAIASCNRGLAIDPLSLQANSMLGLALYLSRQYDKAIDQYRKTLDMEPNYLPARFSLGMSYGQMGMYEEAIVEFQKAGDLVDDLIEAMGEVGYVYGVWGKESKARQVLDDLKRRSETTYISSYNMVKIYAGLREDDLTLEWLRKAYEERSEWLTWLRVDPKLDRIRSDPRFQDLMQRVGFEPQQ